MNLNEPIPSHLTRLWCHISPRRRWQFIYLFVLMLLASFAEVMSIGAVLPFLGVLTAPELVFELPVAQPIIELLGLTESKQLLLPLTIAFSVLALIAGGMRLLLLWSTIRLSFAAGADLSIDIYRRTLYQPYAEHCARNSSVVIDGISNKANGVIYNIIIPTLTLISSSTMLAAILIAFIVFEPLMALTTFSVFGLIYLVIVRLTRKQLIADSRSVALESTKVIKCIQEGLGGIRDVLIDGSQETYCQIYSVANIRLRYAQGNSLFIGAFPRYGVEALGVFFLAVLAYFLAQQTNGIAKAIPFLGALALGAQRLLPLLQQVYGSWTQINSGQASLKEVLNMLDQPAPNFISKPVEELPFSQSITLRQISFRYEEQASYVLNQINLTIPKGSRVGFIGATGSGKSTLLDIVMGLLKPTNGLLEIDGRVITSVNHRAWQSHIAHVPQVIFLADCTIEENIAFGIPRDKIDFSRVKLAAVQAQIANDIECLPKKYQTFVGERGIRLSGGQRQRIGIARALYKQADVIIFDEATSALDSQTEQAVMQAIQSLSEELTLLIIAHRLTTLENCTQIVELSDGKIKRTGRYQDIVN